MNGARETDVNYREKEASRLRKSIAEDTYVGATGALFWVSSDHPVPLHCFRDAGTFPPPAQAEVEAGYAAQALINYKRAQANRSPEQLAEEAYEDRAAHGPGVELVNVFTGERTIT